MHEETFSSLIHSSFLTGVVGGINFKFFSPRCDDVLPFRSRGSFVSILLVETGLAGAGESSPKENKTFKYLKMFQEDLIQ